ncbi:MAG: ABC transporter ATP-binding protein [Bdellovibrionales bacterium]|nr:ABC transporter ATP-binding protein [Bdellovibrionales bacterium]
MLEALKITKTYRQGSGSLEVLKGIDLQVAEGDSLCIIGSSGAGKSTLLHILGTLDRPTSGDVIFRGKNVFTLSDLELAKFRNENIGFVFQFHHLLNEFTAYENMIMPGRLAGWSSKEMRKRADELFSFMGLSDRKTHYPTELSGGEQQRVAIARALFLRPSLLLADEPTGNLDSGNSLKIQQLLMDLKAEFQVTLVVVTHDSVFSERFPRVLRMSGGVWV